MWRERILVRQSTAEQAGDWLMRVAILSYALGVAAALLTRSGTALGSIALMEWGHAHGRILLAERVAALMIGLTALSLLIRPSAPALLLIAGLAFAEACAHYHVNSEPLSRFAVYSQALRYLTPLALIPMIVCLRVPAKGHRRLMTSSWILRVGLAIVFAAHGIEAWQLNPRFIDLIIGSAWNVLGWRIDEPTAGTMLRLIGLVDIAAGILLLVRPWPAVLLWMVFWGLLTAVSRMTALGLGAYPESLMRVSHFLAPLALWSLTAAKIGRSGEAASS